MSRPVAKDDTSVARAAQAVDWFMRVSADDVSEQDLVEWIHWCGNADNLLEFQNIRNTWAGFNQLRPQMTVLLDTLRKGGHDIPFSDRGAVGEIEIATSARRAAPPIKRWRLAAAAAVFGGLAIAAVWYAYDSGLLVPDRHTFAAQTSERSTILPDGSTLALAPKTNAAVNFSGVARDLQLSRGQAYFKVRPNKAKPFVVTAGSLTVTAVGTAFDVRSEANRVVVTVQQGVVEVAPLASADSASPERWRVSAGYQIAYDDDSHSARIRAVDPSHATAWREGRLEYYSEPLSAVVADVSRYSSQPLELGDPELAQLTYTGTVFTESIDDWLNAIQATFPIRAVTTTDHRVLLLKRPDAAVELR